MKPVDILVLGAGDYVCGRDQEEGFGTVLPTLAECHRAGRIGRVTVAATRQSSGVVLQEKLRKLNDRLGTRLAVATLPSAGEDRQAYRTALTGKDRYDASIVVTPDATHFELAKDLLDAGLHCLVVKPLTPTVAEAVTLTRMAESRNLHGAVEFHKRWDEANLYLKSLLRDGRLGDLLYLTVEYSQRKQIPAQTFRAWASQTNVFQYIGVHYADVIYFVTGALPVRAMAVGQKNWLAGRGIDTWDSIQATVEWQDPSGRKFHSLFALNWIDPNSSTAMSNQRIMAVGTEGRLLSDQKKRGLEFTSDAGGTLEPNPYFSAFLPGPDGKTNFGGYGYRSVRQFIEDAAALKAGSLSIGDLQGCRPTFRDAIPSTAVVEAVNRSLRSGGEWISIPLARLETAAVA